MSEFDPRWSAGQQGGAGQPGQQGFGQAGYQGYPGQSGQPGQPGYYDRSGQPTPSEWSQHGYAGTQHGLGGPDQTASFGQDRPTGQPGQPGHPGFGGSMGQGSMGQGTTSWQPGWNPPPPTGQWGSQPHPYGQVYPPVKRSPMRAVGFALGAVGLSVLIGLGIGRIAWQPSSDNASQASNGASSGSTGGSGSTGSSGGANSTSINPSAIASKVDPGLVDINTILSYQQEEAAGTGIVLTSNGEVLTNNHVVEGATSIKVTDIGNGKTYTAKVVGYDRSHDIAVLQMQNASGLATEKIGDSSKVSVGDAVVGIGNAGGAGGTPSVAAGTVTGLNQSITASDESSGASEKLSGLIQVNANIQSGDSGGSLVNSNGEVIGVDTAASQGYQFGGGGSGGYPGSGGGNGGSNGGGTDSGGHQGFAIPINQAMSIAKQILAGTASSTVHIGSSAFMGVSVSDATSQQGASGGALIKGTVPGGAADSAGLVAGDVITSVNGQSIDSATTLTNLMDQHHPGDKLSVVYSDQSGQQHTATVTAASGPVG